MIFFYHVKKSNYYYIWDENVHLYSKHLDMHNLDSFVCLLLHFCLLNKNQEEMVTKMNIMKKVLEIELFSHGIIFT